MKLKPLADRVIVKPLDAEEMTKGGFGYHSIWKNLPNYVLELDVGKIKHDAGLAIK